MTTPLEWLETDGLGGYATGMVAGPRTRRYHSLLTIATAPPAARVMQVAGFDAFVVTPMGEYALSSQRYEPGVVYPDGASRLEAFERAPWPRWTFRMPDGARVVQELFVPRGLPLVALRFRLEGGSGDRELRLRPFLGGRDHHSLHHENPHFNLGCDAQADFITWRPYPSVPAIGSFAKAHYAHEPHWYRRFRYDEERARGLDATEDLVSPGELRWDLSRGDAEWIVGEVSAVAALRAADRSPGAAFARLGAAEQTRRQTGSLSRAAESYLVRRGTGRSLLAGYPWVGERGRDAFISMRGLCLATGRYAEATSILLLWSESICDGLLPNRFPASGAAPAHDSVDAPLWFVIAVSDLFAAARAGRCALSPANEERLRSAALSILGWYARGTRHGIRADDDGLLRAGEPGDALTWMDSFVNGQPVTPRIGKPVEVQALWLCALDVAAPHDTAMEELQRRGLASFPQRFWNAEAGALFDVVDVDHERGKIDRSFRPNQIFAAGGLGRVLIPYDRARRMVHAVEGRLWTPLGLRSLAPGEPAYRSRYEGGPVQRDAAIHQGTVWPWLAGPFVQAWVRVHGDTPEARRGARARFLGPLLRHLDDEAGIGHVSEVADAEPPHMPRGCPFHATSLGELLRLDGAVLAAPSGA